MGDLTLVPARGPYEGDPTWVFVLRGQDLKIKKENYPNDTCISHSCIVGAVFLGLTTPLS